MHPTRLRFRRPAPWFLGLLLGAVLSGVLAFVSGDPPDADAVSRWNAIAFDAGATLERGTTQAREMAMTHLAIHDALNAIHPRFATYTRGPRASADASPDAAIAAAARTVLVATVPHQAEVVHRAYADALAEIPRASEDGRYRRRRSRRAPHPGAAPRRRRLSLGRVDSAARTPERTATARFWAGNVVGSWNEIARNAVNDRNADADPHRHLDPWQTARLYALLNAVMSDGFVAGWYAKYRYHAWRPVTAIQRGDTDGNPATSPDPAWMPLLPTPEHPKYPSTHSVLSATAAGVLDCTLGEDRADVTVTGDGRWWRMTRHYPTFQATARDVAESRLYAGAHFRYANEAGLAQGRRIAAVACGGLLQLARTN